MLATDPLSLFFFGCALFSGLFLVVSVALGVGHGHAGHLGGHGAAHVHAGSHMAGHAMGHAASHAAAHNGGQSPARIATHSAATPATSPGANVWSAIQDTLLGSVNLTGALIFLLLFGVVGYLLHNGQGMAPLLAMVIAALIGALAAIGVNAALTRIFITSQAGELSADNSRLEGQLATVSIAIRSAGIGEVVYTGEAGARHSIGARSADGAAIAAGTQVVIVVAEGGLATVQPWDSFLAETRQRLNLSADQPAPRLEPAAPPGAEPQG